MNHVSILYILVLLFFFHCVCSVCSCHENKLQFSVFTVFTSRRINNKARKTYSTSNGAREMLFDSFDGGDDDEHNGTSLVGISKNIGDSG